MKSYSFLFWGYSVVWTGLVVYFVILGRKTASVARRLDALESKTKRDGSARAT
jgi:CcmD family protein